jgi:hypothetical protein
MYGMFVVPNVIEANVTYHDKFFLTSVAELVSVCTDGG